mmetsp:Transcript_27056/g.88782  ORF Transcript_27056/g.88782 Transcript_27056/m.88782 type:complete len:542 (-) Transcript_27056:3-1628(-)
MLPRFVLLARKRRDGWKCTLRLRHDDDCWRKRMTAVHVGSSAATSWSQKGGMRRQSPGWSVAHTPPHRVGSPPTPYTASCVPRTANASLVPASRTPRPNAPRAPLSGAKSTTRFRPHSCTRRVVSPRSWWSGRREPAVLKMKKLLLASAAARAPFCCIAEAAHAGESSAAAASSALPNACATRICRWCRRPDSAKSASIASLSGARSALALFCEHSSLPSLAKKTSTLASGATNAAIRSGVHARVSSSRKRATNGTFLVNRASAAAAATSASAPAAVAGRAQRGCSASTSRTPSSVNLACRSSHAARAHCSAERSPIANRRCTASTRRGRLAQPLSPKPCCPFTDDCDGSRVSISSKAASDRRSAFPSTPSAASSDSTVRGPASARRPHRSSSSSLRAITRSAARRSIGSGLAAVTRYLSQRLSPKLRRRAALRSIETAQTPEASSPMQIQSSALHVSLTKPWLSASSAGEMPARKHARTSSRERSVRHALTTYASSTRPRITDCSSAPPSIIDACRRASATGTSAGVPPSTAMASACTAA